MIARQNVDANIGNRRANVEKMQPSGLHLFKDCTNGWSLKGNGIVENQSPIDAKVHASQALKKLQILKEDLINFAPATVGYEC